MWGQFGHVTRADKTHGSYGEAANEASDVELGERVGGCGLNDSADDENDTSNHQGSLTSDPVTQWGAHEGTEEAGEGYQPRTSTSKSDYSPTTLKDRNDVALGVGDVIGTSDEFA